MPTLQPDSVEAKQIDEALQSWRQGDLALDENWFSHVADLSLPLSAAAGEAAAEAQDGMQALTSEVRGLVVVTQTCDVVRDCLSRPYVEVAPLIEVSKDAWQWVKRGRRPSQATLPRLEEGFLVADLDRVMTVEKSIVSKWTRTPGYVDDQDARAFALALARKRVRFAFPDDFGELVGTLEKRLIEKHDKKTDEGRGLRALREIRVQAAPAWDAQTVELHFWFIRNDEDADFEGKSWADLLEAWLKLAPANGRFESVEGVVVTLQGMTAEEYVESDPLDLDHLSPEADE